MKCFYHRADLDGQCSGAVVKFLYPDCELIGIDYGEGFPWSRIVQGETVFMVDFSLQPFDGMLSLADCTGFTWVDHHKTAIEEAGKCGGCFYPKRQILDPNFAACELCWNHLAVSQTGLDIPLSVHWLGRYDIWKHKETPGSLEFQYGMRLQDTDPNNQEFWRRLFTDNAFAESIRDDGANLLAYERQQNAKFIAVYGFETQIDGLRCIAANRGMTNSLLFESRWDTEKYDAMLCFAWKGGKWTVSLYTDKPGVDVSVVCKTRGGGGHKGAAGFQCDELSFLRPEKAEG